MLVALENAKSLTYYAAWAVDQELDELHGGIGMTWEHDLQLYFKRAKASEVAFGDANWHRERVAQLMRL